MIFIKDIFLVTAQETNYCGEITTNKKDGIKIYSTVEKVL
jgi:hypothetical protein